MTRAEASTTSIYRPPLTRWRAVFGLTLAAAVVVSSIALIIHTGCLELVVASSNEKADLLHEMVMGYTPERVERRCVMVTITEVASGTAERALANDWKGMPTPRPHVWSPASKTWLLLLDEDRGKRGLSPIVPAVAQSIITSPLVIAMLEPMATALQQASPRPGWRDLVILARDPAGWARFGRPWGAFKFAQTTPFISTSGLHAMLAINSAAQPEADPDQFVRDLDRSVLHYADSVRTFLGQLYQADEKHQALSYMSAIAVEEKQVFDYNRGNPNSDVCDDECGRIPNPKLRALYPRDGTLIADHPFAVLNWPTQTDSGLYAQAARNLQSFLEDTEQQDRFKAQGFRDHRTQAGPQLQEPYFDPNEPTYLLGVPRAQAVQQLRTHWKDSIRKPANAILLFDVDPSLSRLRGDGLTRFDAAKAAVVEALNELGQRDAIGLRTFPSETGTAFREVLDIAPIGPSPTQLATTVKGLAVEPGPRALYAAVRGAAETVKTRYASDQVNAVVLVTDGKDDSADRLDVLESWFAEQFDRRVLLFVVALPSAPDDLRRVVSAAGGIFYRASTDRDVPEMIRRALLNL